MTKISNPLFAAMILAGLIGVTGAHAQFEPTAADRAACDKDAFKLCTSAMPNKDAVMQCLRGKKAQLSPRCRAQFDKRGG